MLESSPPTSSPPASAEPRSTDPHPPVVVIFIEENGGDWHAARLRQALQARGARVLTTCLKHCAFDTGAPHGLLIPGLEPGRLPDGVFVRSVSAGTLEEITFRLGILHALSHLGVRVWNPARAIERCVDKSTATFLMQSAGLPVPATRTVEGREAALGHAQGRLPLVVKPLFGSQGNGVRRVDGIDGLPEAAEVNGVYYMQEYLRDPSAEIHEDWRVFVSAGSVVAAMVRRSETWITNVHQGARPERLAVDPEAERLALGAATAVGADYAGVDLIRAADGRLLVLEINSNPAWKGLQSTTELDIAARLADDFLIGIRNSAYAP